MFFLGYFCVRREKEHTESRAGDGLSQGTYLLKGKKDAAKQGALLEIQL